MVILQKAISRFKAIPIKKNSRGILYRNRKKNPQIHMEPLQIAKVICSKKNNPRGVAMSDFKL